jgi:hypothetical protein
MRKPVSDHERAKILYEKALNICPYCGERKGKHTGNCKAPA